MLVWPDIFGLRPAFRPWASGWRNPVCRTHRQPLLSFHQRTPASREDAFSYAGTLSPATHVTDAKAFVAWLDAQKAVDKNRKIGTTGYCMGGPIVMRTAATVPKRIGAGGSFHGGGLTTTNEDSPHLLIPKMKAVC